MGKVIHIEGSSGGGGGGTGTGFIGIFTNYNDLIAQFPTAPLLSLAYVENSQGTPWLPGTMLGTFYSKGTYLWNGLEWSSDVDEIAKALEDINNEIAALGLPEILTVDNTTGANDIIINESNFLIHEYATFFNSISTDILTSNRFQLHQDKNGIIALLSDIPPITPTPPLSVVLGIGNQTNGNDIIVNENDTLKLEYANFLNNISTNPLTSNRDIRFPDNSGTVALKKNIALSQGYNIQSILTVPTLTATVNNWNPTGFDSETDLIRVNVNANNREITGIVAPPLGVNRILGIKNLNSVGNDLRFENNNAGSSPQNRFLCRDNNRKSIKPNEMALWFYDHIIQRWTPFNRIG